MSIVLKITRVTLSVALWVSMAGVSVAAETLPGVSVPERTRVCMMQDTLMAVPAIPLASNGKTYYGCCEMCKAKIAAEPERYKLARDPVSGATVDKATAVLLSVDGRVLYFESDKSRDQFVDRLTPGR